MRTAKAIIIFFIALVAFVRFAPQDERNPQHITRIGLAYSLSEGRLDIDRFATLTVDKAEHGGHFYADKTPGLSLMAVPAVFVARQVMLASGTADPNADMHTFHRYVTVAAVSTNCLASALAVMLLYLFARRLGATDAAALFGSAALAFATPYFAWSSTFFAHPMSGNVLLFGAMIVGWHPRAENGSALGRGLALGLLFGFLMVIDLTAAPPAAFIALWAVLRSQDRGREITGGVIGGLIGIAPLLLYNFAVFGSPFKLGYSQVVGFEGMKSGLFGISLPDPMVLGELLFGHFRGLLPLSPVLLLVPFGLRAMWNADRTHGLSIVVALTVLSYLLINSSYFYWDGGSSSGPRHLVAMLPMAALALVFAWPPRKSQRWVVLALLVVSLLLSWVVATTETFANANYPNPLFDYLLPEFLSERAMMRGMLVPLHWLAFAALVLLRDDRLGPKRDKLAA